jgi:hypothetical protein
MMRIRRLSHDPPTESFKSVSGKAISQINPTEFLKKERKIGLSPNTREHNRDHGHFPQHKLAKARSHFRLLPGPYPILAHNNRRAFRSSDDFLKGFLKPLTRRDLPLIQPYFASTFRECPCEAHNSRPIFAIVAQKNIKLVSRRATQV